MSFTSRYRSRIAYLLLILFSLPGVGFSTSVHYCNGHLSGLNVSLESRCCVDKIVEVCGIAEQPTNKCCSKPSPDGKDCCTDKPSFNQLDYDGLSHAQISSNIALPLLFIPTKASIYPTINHQVNFNPLCPQPPPLSGYQLRVVLGSFLC